MSKFIKLHSLNTGTVLVNIDDISMVYSDNDRGTVICFISDSNAGAAVIESIDEIYNLIK